MSKKVEAMHWQLLRLCNTNTQFGQRKRPQNNPRNRDWNAMSIRSIVTQRVCRDVAGMFGRWMEERHPEIKMVRDLRAEHALEWLREKQAKGLAARSLKSYRERLTKLARRAKWRGWCDSVELITGRLSEVEIGDVRSLETRVKGGGYSEAEVRRLFAEVALRDESAALVCRVILGAGLRASESVTLTRRQVVEGIERGQTMLKKSQTKGGKERTALFNADSRGALRELLVRSGWGPRPLALRESPLKTRRYVYRVLTESAKSLGIRPRGLHGLRATAVRRWFRVQRMRGASKLDALRYVSLRSGHGRLVIAGAYLQPGPGEKVRVRSKARGAGGAKVPDAWKGREGALERLLAIGRALMHETGMTPGDLVEMRLEELDDVLRRGYAVVRGQWQPVSRAIRRVLEGQREGDYAGKKYPFRLGLRAEEAKRLWSAQPMPPSAAVRAQKGRKAGAAVAES